MASSATIPMAQSVTIPNNVVLVSPTSSAPQISDLKDKGLVFRAYPSDALQSKVLAAAAPTKFGRGAKLNVGARNDAFGAALQSLFVAEWKRLGGSIGASVSWNPDQANFDTDAAKFVDGDPAGWILIDFPDTFEKFAPSLVRSGKWSATKTLGIEALRNAETLDKIGDPVKGLSGSAGSAAGGPGRQGVRGVLEEERQGGEGVHRFRRHGVRRGDDRLPRRRTRLLVVAREDQGEYARGVRAARAEVTFLNLAAGVKAAASGKDINYEGTFSPVDFDQNGDIGSAVYEIWQYDGGGKITTLRTITFRGS